MRLTFRFYIPKYKFHLTNEQNEMVHGRTCSEKIEKEFQLYETPSDESLKGLFDGSVALNWQL